MENVLDIICTIASFTSLCSYSCKHKAKRIGDNNESIGDNESNEVVEMFEELAFRCLQTIDKNAEQLMESEDWLLLPDKMVQFVVKRDTLSISSEMVVVKALNRWCNSVCNKKGIMATLKVKVDNFQYTSGPFLFS